MSVYSRKTPRRRFKEFVNDEEWKEYKLEELCSIITKQTGFDYSATIKPALQTEASDINYPFIQNKDFSGININLQTDFFIPKDIAEAFPKILLDRPSILISISGKIGNIGLYRLNNKAFIGGAVGICKLLDDSNGELIVYELLSNIGQSNFLSLIKASSHSNITVEDIRNLPIKIPKLSKEKKLVSDFFINLDNLLAIQQQKLKKLKALKKAYLAQMFPEKGERKPKLRFDGFNSEWEECKLADVADIIGGGTPSTGIAEYWDGSIDWYSPTEIGQKTYADRSVKKITELGLKNSSAKLLPANRTILFTSRAGIGDMAILRNNAATNQGFQSLALKDNCDIYFMYSIGHLIKQYAMQNASGSTFLEISGKQLAKMNIQIPSLQEQQQIGTFFSHIDKLITMHQRKLEKLQNIKKAYLNEMFI